MTAIFLLTHPIVWIRSRAGPYMVRICTVKLRICVEM